MNRRIVELHPQLREAIAAVSCLLVASAAAAETQLLWGNTHQHPSYSTDSRG